MVKFTGAKSGIDTLVNRSKSMEGHSYYLLNIVRGGGKRPRATPVPTALVHPIFYFFLKELNDSLNIRAYGFVPEISRCPSKVITYQIK